MVEILLFFLQILLLGGLAFTVLIDSYISREHRNVMLLIVALALGVIVLDWFDIDETNRLVRTFIAAYGYTARPILLILYGCIVSKKRHDGPAWVLAGINAAIHMTAFFSNICFCIVPETGFYRGPLGYTCHVVSAVLLFRLIWLTFSEHRHLKSLEMLIPILNATIIIAAVVADSFIIKTNARSSCVNASLVACSLFYYIWLHLQFVREHEQALVDGQRVQLMLSQIKPHFLYNTLNAMKDLCDEDPEQVKTAIDRFARYLRGNMASIDRLEPIPFEQELEHTRIYLEIEQMRFMDALQVRCDIACTDFTIPAMTLEPLVENAVRHGVRGNPGGRGTVLISTRQGPGYCEVSVADDGPGFDPEQPVEDGKPHVGIANVRERLKKTCGGVLKIESAPGKGTTATILLPKNSGGLEAVSSPPERCVTENPKDGRESDADLCHRR